MKHVFALLSFLLPIIAFGQCGQLQHCANKRLPYKFCPLVGGKHQVACAENPNAVAGKTPAKNILPICARFVNNADAPGVITIKDANGVDVTVYDPVKIQEDIDAAVAAWNCICGYTQSNQQVSTCCTEIKWTRNPADLVSSTPGLSILGRQKYGFYTSGACEIGCEEGRLLIGSNNKMLLNNIEEFRHVASAGPQVEQALYTGTTKPKGPGNTDLIRESNIWSLRQIITHELGHWLGLEHPDNGDQDDPQYICDGGDAFPAMMNSNGKANDDPLNLTDQDKCQFMKLYCPALTPVANEVIEQLANQTRKEIVGPTYRVSDLLSTNATVQVWSVNGELLSSSIVDVNNGVMDINLDQFRNMTIAIVVRYGFGVSLPPFIRVVQVRKW